MISDGMPLGTLSPSISCRSGIITAWYGMNIPNRMSVNTRFAFGKRHRDSTNPFIEPRNEEMIAAGTTICTVRRIAGDRVVHAACQLTSVQTCGQAQARAGEASPTPLKLVTTSTYTGIRTVSYTHLTLP